MDLYPYLLSSDNINSDGKISQDGNLVFTFFNVSAGTYKLQIQSPNVNALSE